jgi:hypothetical protein
MGEAEVLAAQIERELRDRARAYRERREPDSLPSVDPAIWQVDAAREHARQLLLAGRGHRLQIGRLP